MFMACYQQINVSKWIYAEGKEKEIEKNGKKEKCELTWIVFYCLMRAYVCDYLHLSTDAYLGTYYCSFISFREKQERNFPN